MPSDTTTEVRAEETAGRAPRTSGSNVRVEYGDDAATLHLSPDPDDVAAAARLLCATVQHVRRRHTRRVHTAFDVAGPAGGVLLAALRSRVGTDVGEIVLRRAGASVMVTAELLPAAGGLAARPAATGSRPGERPCGRDPRPTSHPRPRATPGTRT